VKHCGGFVEAHEVERLYLHGRTVEQDVTARRRLTVLDMIGDKLTVKPAASRPPPQSCRQAQRNASAAASECPVHVPEGLLPLDATEPRLEEVPQSVAQVEETLNAEAVVASV